MAAWQRFDFKIYPLMQVCIKVFDDRWLQVVEWDSRIPSASYCFVWPLGTPDLGHIDNWKHLQLFAMQSVAAYVTGRSQITERGK